MPFVLLMACSIAIPPASLGPLVPGLAMVLLGLGGGMNALSTTLLRQTSFIGGAVFGFLRVASALGNMFGGASVGLLYPLMGRLALPCIAATSIMLAMASMAFLLRMREARSKP